MPEFFDLSPCPDCKATGGDLETCMACMGMGRKLAPTGEPTGEACPFCQGKGERKGCMTCAGMGFLHPDTLGAIERRRRAEAEKEMEPYVKPPADERPAVDPLAQWDLPNPKG